MSLEYFFKLFMGGLTLGSIYALISLGYTMVYGIIQLINFAHGEIYMIGAFVALIIAGALSFAGLPFGLVTVIAIMVAIVYSSSYGYTLEMIAYKPLRKSSRLSALISAIGMSIFLADYVRIVQTEKFLPFPNLIPEFAFLDGVKNIIRTSQFMILVTTLLVMIVLTILVKYTKIGKAMRATSQDMTMATLLGVNVNRVISFTFVIGSATAAIGGVLIANHIQQINNTIGFMAGIKAFVAAVLGGIGSLPGAVLGSFLIGFAESYIAGLWKSDYVDIVVFLILILVLTVKPSGILGKNTNQKV
jgi:branched-chain amino acid transport system permease protein